MDNNRSSNYSWGNILGTAFIMLLVTGTILGLAEANFWVGLVFGTIVLTILVIYASHRNSS